MKKAIMLLALLISFPKAYGQLANPDAPIMVDNNRVLQVPLFQAGFGPSQPEEHKLQFGDHLGPSRAHNGEVISITFRNSIRVSSIKMLAYSNDGSGKVLIREVWAHGEENEAAILLEELYLPEHQSEGIYQNYRGAVMIEDNGYIFSPINRVLKSIKFRVEGFTNNDATLVLEVASNQPFLSEDLIIRRERHSSKGHYGNYVNEEDYAQFSTADFETLIANSSLPSPEQLISTSWVCSTYPSYKHQKRTIDYKTRKYFLNENGILKSLTDLKSEDSTTWILTEDGLKASIGKVRACQNKVPSYYALRMTAGGNLITELVVAKEDIYSSCYYYSKRQLNEYYARIGNYQSFLNDRYFAPSREFCRPIRN